MIISLIVCCVIGMLYTGGLFEGVGIKMAFSESDASVGLMLGSFCALVITIIYYLLRRIMNLKKCMECLPEGFKAMVPAIISFVTYILAGFCKSAWICLPVGMAMVVGVLLFMKSYYAQNR